MITRSHNTEMKDLFSSNSELYSLARPSYPIEVVQELLNLVPENHFVWDCGAGSGQFTQLLAPYFDHVVATDISEQQLSKAPYFENVSYQLQSAEKTSFAAHSFDLITVAQAVHWFDFDEFYAEVYRTLKIDGIFAVIGYGLIHVEHPVLNRLIHQLYFEVLDGYWDPERKYIDDLYQTIPFPFEEISVPKMTMQYQWSKEQLINYLNTWSALKHFREKNQNQPLVEIQKFLENDHESVLVEFPVLFRAGKLQQKRRKRLMKKKNKF